MKRLTKILAFLAAAFAFVACQPLQDVFNKDNPTAPNPKVPFGAPDATWDTGIGDMLVYATGGRNWTGATEAEFQDALDSLLFRIDRLVGPEARAHLSLAGTNLVLKDTRERTRYEASENAFWVSDAGEFQVLALHYFCDTSGSKAICDLE